MMGCDPTSFSNSNAVKTKSIDINWTVDFCNCILKGHVDLKVEILEDTVSEVVRCSVQCCSAFKKKLNFRQH